MWRAVLTASVGEGDDARPLNMNPSYMPLLRGGYFGSEVQIYMVLPRLMHAHNGECIRDISIQPDE